MELHNEIRKEYKKEIEDLRNHRSMQQKKIDIVLGSMRECLAISAHVDPCTYSNLEAVEMMKKEILKTLDRIKELEK